MEAGKSFQIKVFYRPSGNSGGKVEEEKLIMKVTDGDPRSIRCSGQANEAKCTFLQRDQLQLKDGNGILDLK